MWVATRRPHNKCELVREIVCQDVFTILDEEKPYECVTPMKINVNLRRSRLRLLSGARLLGETGYEVLCLRDDCEGRLESC